MKAMEESGITVENVDYDRETWSGDKITSNQEVYVVRDVTQSLIDSNQFDGMWASSLTDSTAKGKPDIEAVDTSSRLNTLNEFVDKKDGVVLNDNSLSISGGINSPWKVDLESLDVLIREML